MNMIIKVEDEIWFPFIGYGWKPFEWMVFKRCKDVIRKYNAWIKDLCEEHNHNPIHENVFDFHGLYKGLNSYLDINLVKWISSL